MDTRGYAAEPQTADSSQGSTRAAAAPREPHMNFEGKPVALKDLPKEEIRAYLANFATALRLADQAAHCDHCDWEFPPLNCKILTSPWTTFNTCARSPRS